MAKKFPLANFFSANVHPLKTGCSLNGASSYVCEVNVFQHQLSFSSR